MPPHGSSPRLVFATLVLTLTACTTKVQRPDSAVAIQAGSVSSSAIDRPGVARSLTLAAMAAPGDRVLVSGSVRDAELLEDIAVEVMKHGGQPMIAVFSDRLNRRSFDEVPTSFDTLPPRLGIAIANAFDVQISVEVGESDSALAGVPAARVAARAKAYQAANEALLKSGVRLVNIGNGLYPTVALAKRLGVPQSELASTFWRAAAVSPELLRTRATQLRDALAGGKSMTITAANGTNLTFAVDASRASVSDGAITPDKVKQGKVAAYTWLPAGELLVPAVLGTAEGKLVIDKLTFQGTDVVGLALTFHKGRLTEMTAASGLEPLKAAYDAAGSGKDQFSFIDLGVNPEVRLPLTSGRIIWMAAGGVTIGVGDNQLWNGTNVSDFSLAAQVAAATLTVDGKPVIDRGALSLSP